MSTQQKIAIIGAGSAVFSMHLVRDLALTHSLKGSKVVFMDTDERRLSLIKTLAERFKHEVGADISIESTHDRVAAISDANFVVNTALAGGFTQMEAEREAQIKNGYYHGIAVHAPHRQLKLMCDIASDIKNYAAPDAYLLQSSNPLPEGCTLMFRETGINIVGLCNGYLDLKDAMPQLETKWEQIAFEAIGINHVIWMTKFLIDGKDGYPHLNDWIANKSEEYWATWDPDHEDRQMSPASIDLYKLYGLMPIGDTCRAIWPEAWWYHTDPETKKRWWGPHGGVDAEDGWKMRLAALAARVDRMEQAANDTDRSILEMFPAVKSTQPMIPIIDALVNNHKADFQVNIPNNGLIPGLPDDFFVEVPAVIDASGIHPKRIAILPQSIMLGVILPRWIFAERLIAAYQTGDYRFMLQAYLSDHKTKSREQAEKTIRDITKLEFNEAMRERFGEIL